LDDLVLVSDQEMKQAVKATSYATGKWLDLLVQPQRPPLNQKGSREQESGASFVR
jgi:hypothetical protein